MDYMGVVAALEVEIRLLGQAVVHHNVEPVRSAKRRYRTRLTIEKERLNLFLTSDVHVLECGRERANSGRDRPWQGDQANCLS